MRFLLFVIAVVTVFCLFSMGCATAEIRDKDGNLVKKITGYGAFRDIDHSITTHPDGTITETLSTKSTTSDIMNAANKIIGTGAGIAEKGMP